MSALTHLKLGLTVIGLILFAYGMRADDTRLRWIGIAFFAVAAILRFVRRRTPEDDRSND